MNNNSNNNEKNLPIIIIKKIINYLIYKDYNYIKKLFFISKNLQTFIINQISFFGFDNLKSLKSFSNNNDNGKSKQLLEEIEKIEIKDQLIKSFNMEAYLNFKNLKEWKLTYTIGIKHKEIPNRIECESIEQVSNNLLKSNKFKISYTTNDYYYFKNHFNTSNCFNVLKKIKLKSFSIDIDTLNTILTNSIHLESLEIILYFNPVLAMNFQFFGDNQLYNTLEHERKFKKLESLLSSSSSHLDDDNLKNSLKSFSIEIEQNHSKLKYDNNYKSFCSKIIPNILKSPFQNISKIYFKDINFNGSSMNFFSSLSRDNITKLKLVNCFHDDDGGGDGGNSEDSFNYLLNYLNENQNLKRLSIGNNNFIDKENKLAAILKTHKSLSKIDISYTAIQLNPLLNSIIYNQWKFIKLTISGNSDPSTFFNSIHSIETLDLLSKLLITPINNFNNLIIKCRFSLGETIFLSKEFIEKLLLL
ncbi:hypothetical protein ACTFIW_007859 [Dictyostelium discoideum]